MRHLNGFLIVFIGGGLGSMARHGINLAASSHPDWRWPFGTLFVNVAGSCLIGIAAEFFALRTGLSPNLRFFLTTGILGGFTTFSAFSLEVGLLQARGDTAGAVGYALASVVLGVGAMLLGMFGVRYLAV